MQRANQRDHFVKEDEVERRGNRDEVVFSSMLDQRRRMREGLRQKYQQQMNHKAGDPQSDHQMLERGFVAL